MNSGHASNALLKEENKDSYNIYIARDRQNADFVGYQIKYKAPDILYMTNMLGIFIYSFVFDLVKTINKVIIQKAINTKKGIVIKPSQFI